MTWIEPCKVFECFASQYCQLLILGTLNLSRHFHWQQYGKFVAHLDAKNKTPSWLLFWDFLKIWECLTILAKIIGSICSNFSSLSTCKKSTSSFTFFLRYCNEIVTLLFWVISGCLAIHHLNDSTNFKKPLTFICKQKINFILHVLFERLQRCCKLAVYNLQKTFVFFCKISTSFPMLFWRHSKDIQTSCFGCFWHVLLYTPKMIVWTCRRLQCLPACQK